MRFGRFGALNGGCIDKNINTEIYMGEMRRYYSNIVGKFGNPVQKALQKCSGLDIMIDLSYTRTSMGRKNSRSSGYVR